VLRYTDGDLRAAAMAVIALPEAWAPAAKRRSPTDYVVAVLRALDIGDYNRAEFRNVLAALEQDFLAAPTPNGWPDTADGWDSERTLTLRRAWVHGLAVQAPGASSERVAEQALGGAVKADTPRQVQAAGSRAEALSALLASPAFMLR
jgi:uncharacterized protein (DUF1800 family)